MLSEEEQSIALARQLMEEEAMASYQSSWQLLQQSADQLSEEDMAALRAAMMEDEREEVSQHVNEEGELSYDAMLNIGEIIGDVKAERWKVDAQKHISKLKDMPYCHEQASREQEKCLICQCEFETDEIVTQLPCNHVFHSQCVKDGWLVNKDFCPYCRTSIVITKE